MLNNFENTENKHRVVQNAAKAMPDWLFEVLQMFNKIKQAN